MLVVNSCIIFICCSAFTETVLTNTCRCERERAVRLQNIQAQKCCRIGAVMSPLAGTAGSVQGESAASEPSALSNQAHCPSQRQSCWNSSVRYPKRRNFLCLRFQYVGDESVCLPADLYSA
ncbi:hypothetical protein XENOCAPTIV_003711 [Xenoophorus captivus]|uniref:Secreted protein n=1 Tax=Xenoophorus captivus TaxID=1517983 RepID=A0ABV0S5A2_9TELE